MTVMGTRAITSSSAGHASEFQYVISNNIFRFGALDLAQHDDPAAKKDTSVARRRRRVSFSRYPKYKASGVEWLGEVPERWLVTPLKRQFTIVSGSTPQSDVQAYWDGEILWATPADLGKGSDLRIRDTLRHITANGLASCGASLVPPSSIVLSTRAPIGSLSIAASSLCTNQGCKSLVPLPGVDSTYFARLLSVSTEQLNVRGKGTTFLELSADALGSFDVPVPPLDEQGAIAEFLGHETTKIDGLLAEQQRLMELLKEKRRGGHFPRSHQGPEPRRPPEALRHRVARPRARALAGRWPDQVPIVGG
jgi:type I restriction enzyme S subunit